MARKFYEQMLINELEIRKATSFPKWYATPNQMYYGLWNQEFNQDVKNITRVNRQDLYSVEYFRQPFWMPPQNLVFPHYQPVPVCFVRRNNRRFFSGRNSFSREKRSNSDKKFLRQEDGLNFKGEGVKATDFQSQFERYQEGWSKDGSHHQMPRDDRGVSYLAIRNSNFDLCPENMMVQQHVAESRHPSLECISAHENLSHTGYSRSKNSMQADSQNNYQKTSELDWENQADHVSKSTDLSQYPASQNYNNNNESWYCPEEQQKIVDMLKEVNLRHDRQMKSDMLLSQNEQSGSEDLVSSINDSQTSLSSDDEEDNVTIQLYPGGIPPVPEAEEEYELFKTECYDKSVNNLFEEFQNIFTGSPEKEIINKLIKEASEQSQIMENDDDLENTGKVITDDDKNAVKKVLDFDHMDDQTENTFDNCKNIVISSVEKTALDDLENQSSAQTSDKQNIVVYEECHRDMEIRDSDMKTKDVEMISDSDSVSQLNNSSKSHGCSEIVESDDNVLLPSLKQTRTTLGSKNYPKTKSAKDSEFISINHSIDLGKYVNEDSCVTKAGNDTYCNNESGSKSKTSIRNTSKEIPNPQFHQKKISQDSYDKGTFKNKLHVEGTENQYNNSFLCNKITSSTLNNMKVFVSNRSNANISHGNLHGIKNIVRTEISQNNATNDVLTTKRPLFSHKTFQKKKCGLSISEPLLSPKRNHTEFKRISVSEIFSNSSEVLKHGYQHSFNKQNITHIIDLNRNMNDMSPSEHLKLILGIGQNNGNIQPTCKNTLNNSETKATSDASDTTYKIERNSKTQNFEFTAGSLHRKDLESSSYTHEDSTKVKGMNKENQSKAPEEVTSFDKYVNRKSFHKYSDKNIDSSRFNKLPSESNTSESIQDFVTKCKRKQKSRKAKTRKESFPDEKMPSPINFTQPSFNQNSSCDSNGNKIPKKKTNINQNPTLDVELHTHKSSREIKRNNECILNGDSRIKSETEKLKSWTSNYSDCKKLFKNNENLMSADSSNLSINTRKTSDEIFETAKCNVTSSNLDQMKPVSNEKIFLDQTFSSFPSKNDKNSSNLTTGIYFKHKYTDFQTYNSKYFYQKRYDKNTHIDAEFSSESNKKGNLLTSLNSKSDSAKFQTANSKYCYNKSTVKDNLLCPSPKGSQLSVCIEKCNGKLSSADKMAKIGKTNKIKGKEKSHDKCENQSNLEQYNKTMQNNKMNYPSKESLQKSSIDPMNEISIKNASSNSMKDSTNFIPSSETGTKHKYSEMSHAVESPASSFNNAVLVSGQQKYISKFNGYAENMKEENPCLVSRDSIFHSSKSRKVNRMDENAFHKEENFAENTALSKNDKHKEKLSFSSLNKVEISYNTNFNEDSKEKFKYVEETRCNNDKNSFLEENVLHRSEEKMQKNAMRSKNSTMKKGFPCMSDSNNLCYDKTNVNGEKKEFYKKENHNSDLFSISNEKETEVLAYNGLQQEKQQNIFECTNQERIEETDKAHYYKNIHATNGELLPSKKLNLKVVSDKGSKEKAEEVVKTTVQENPFAFSPVMKHVDNRKTDILLPSEEHSYTCSNNRNLLISKDLKLQATTNKDMGGKTEEHVKTTFQENPFGRKDFQNRKTGILSPPDADDYTFPTFVNTVCTIPLLADASKATHSLLNECSIDLDLMESECTLKNKEQNNPLIKNVSLNDKSLKSKTSCILKKMENFGDLFKYFIGSRKRELKNKNLKIFTSGEYEIKNSSKQQNTDFIKSVVLTVTPEVMETYKRNKKASKMNPFLDVHFHFYLEDFFSEFKFIRLDSKFKKCYKSNHTQITGKKSCSCLVFVSECMVHG